MNPPLAAARRLLALDAAACLLTGALLAFVAGALAEPTGLDLALLRAAGLSLFPVAALFGWMARTPRLGPGLVRLAVAGNVAWVAASLAVPVLARPTPLGLALVLGQALAVAALAWAEHRSVAGGEPIATTAGF